MGNEASLPMEMATNFDAEEIKRLGKRFKKLDLDNSGSLSVDEFMSLPELQQVELNKYFNHIVLRHKRLGQCTSKTYVTLQSFSF